MLETHTTKKLPVIRSNVSRFDFGGLAQHSLVEHALCALDPRQSMVDGYMHKTGYFFQDRNRNRKRANVTVACPFGLSPNDELFLWGLLQLAFLQDDPTPEFIATPHFCLKQLGIVDQRSSQGKRYELFRQAIRRLAGVVYCNDKFYDAMRDEHRDVAFGFLKYNLPIDPNSSRAWRFVWDQQFFDYCKTRRGSFQFDLPTYRQFDFATRRLYLFLAKVFWRQRTITADIRHLTIDVLGFSETLPLKTLKKKLLLCTGKLLDAHIVMLPGGADSASETVSKRQKGRYDITFHRGCYFDEPMQGRATATLRDSPAYDPLKTIGFEDYAIRRILTSYKPKMIQDWADITLAAMERKKITKDPKAFFHYYVKRAASGQTTPPDWWHELRKREARKRFEEQRAAAPTLSDALGAGQDFDAAFEKFLEDEARETFENIMHDLFGQFTKAGQSRPEAERAAETFARQHLRNRFLTDHPEFKRAA